MKYAIIYWSRFGNNKKIAETLAQKLAAKPAETHILTTDQANPASMPQADVYIFSAPAEAFNLQKNMRTFMKKIQGMDGKKYGIINTHGMNRNWLGKMEKLLSKKNMIKIAETDFKVTDKDPATGKPSLKDWEPKLDSFIQKL